MDDLTTLISRVHGGDRQAYGDIVGRFQHMAVGYATSCLGDPHLAEDAAQEAFLQAFVDLAQLREPAAFPGWFRRIVHKHCDQIRRRQTLHLVPLEEDQWEARSSRCPDWNWRTGARCWRWRFSDCRKRSARR